MLVLARSRNMTKYYLKWQNLKKRRGEAGEKVASQGEGGQPGQSQENLMSIRCRCKITCFFFFFLYLPLMILSLLFLFSRCYMQPGQTQENLKSSR